jgi:hypothetical protein
VVNTPNVNVVNTTSNPVPVIGTTQSADNPALSAVGMDFFVQFNGSHGHASVTISAGKIFVLEFVTFRSPQTVTDIALTTTGPLITGGQGTITYFLARVAADANVSTDGSQLVRLYLQPAANLDIDVFVASQAANNSIKMSLSGYFVNAQ